MDSRLGVWGPNARNIITRDGQSKRLVIPQNSKQRWFNTTKKFKIVAKESKKNIVSGAFKNKEGGWNYSFKDLEAGKTYEVMDGDDNTVSTFTAASEKSATSAKTDTTKTLKKETAASSDAAGRIAEKAETQKAETQKADTKNLGKQVKTWWNNRKWENKPLKLGDIPKEKLRGELGKFVKTAKQKGIFLKSKEFIRIVPEELPSYFSSMGFRRVETTHTRSGDPISSYQRIHELKGVKVAETIHVADAYNHGALLGERLDFRGRGVRLAYRFVDGKKSADYVTDNDVILKERLGGLFNQVKKEPVGSPHRY